MTNKEQTVETTTTTEAVEELVKWRMFELQNSTIVSDHDDSPWHIGQVRTVDTEFRHVACCNWGFHCSDDIMQARGNISGCVVARVNVSGEHDIRADKSAWEHMTILEAWIVPCASGIGMRLNAFLSSEKYLEYASDFDQWDVEPDELEYAYADSYALSRAFDTIASYIPRDLLPPALEEFVRTFMPLSHPDTTPEKRYAELNSMLDELLALKQQVYSEDELAKLAAVINAASSVAFKLVTSSSQYVVTIPSDTYAKSKML